MSSSRRILLVDDNADSVESLAQLLMLSGHDARVALDGPSALEIAQSFQPEVVVCDIGLPGMNGYDVARALRAMPLGKTLFLAALTGYGMPDDRQRTARAGFDAHLVKPVNATVIETLLDEHFA